MKILFKNANVLFRGKCDVAVAGDRISDIGTIGAKGFDRVIDCTGRLLMPGLYNTHTHAAMTLFRGYGEDMPLDRWLTERIFPAEDLLTDRAVYIASLLAAAEMIRNGIVSFTDMYFFCDNTVKAVTETGMKANISRSIVHFDCNADPAKDKRVDEAVRLFKDYHNAENGRIKIDMALHAEYTNTERMCRYLADTAKKLGANMQVHLSETGKEHKEGIARRGGKTPAEFLCGCGVFDVPATAAHCVYVTENDMDIMREKKVTAAHNPVSNLKLGSGVMPLSKMLEHGVNVTLGTDGAASNNTLDIFKEMQVSAILHKGIERKPDNHRASEFIVMATENGARAQGREDCGRIGKGMKADIILIDLDTVNNIPMFDPAYTVVYSANSSNVCLTMADGRILYENGEYTTVDIEKLKHDMRFICENYFRKK